MAKSAIRSDICAVRLTAHTLTRGIATVALLGLVLLSCDGNRLTDTGARAPLRPSMSHITVPPPAGSYDLPDPANSGGDGSAVSERETGITIPEGDHYVRVRVTGGIVITSTDPAAPINGYMVGPWGLTSHTPFQYCDVDSCALSVVPRFYNTPTTSTGFFLNDVGNYLGESVALVTGPGWFTVERMGLSCAGDEGPCLYFSGHQTLSIDFVALALHASDTTRAAGEVVHFEAEGVNVNLGTPVFWEWWPAGADDFTLVDACADHLECDFAPPSDGLMEAQSWVGDGMGSGYVAGEVKIRLATEAAAVTIIKAEGPNGGSFTTIPGENRLSLEASVMPAESSPAWELIDEPEDQVQTRPPGNVEPTTGTTVEADMPPQDPNRWRNVPHPGTLKEKSLAVRVTAIVTGPGGEVRSPARTVSQDEIDTMREEYFELKKHRVPARAEMESRPRGFPGENAGDYAVAVVNPGFETKVDALRVAWAGQQWQYNTIFRNPVHNDYHIPASARADPNSWHQYGCAADLQTFPYPRNDSNIKLVKKFWHGLAMLAAEKGFDVEPQGRSGLGHVHVEIDCP